MGALSGVVVIFARSRVIGGCQRMTGDVANGLGTLSKLVSNAKLFLMEKLVCGRPI